MQRNADGYFDVYHTLSIQPDTYGGGGYYLVDDALGHVSDPGKQVVSWAEMGGRKWSAYSRMHVDLKKRTVQVRLEAVMHEVEKVLIYRVG